MVKKYHLLMGFMVKMLLFSSSFVNADWYEATGVSTILENEETARARALEDAVFQVLEFSGADIGNVMLLRPYLEKVHNTYLFEHNEIKEIIVSSTSKQNGMMKVTARIDVYPSATDCHKRQYRKGIVFAPFSIRSLQEATLGGIFSFGQDFTKLLSRQFSTQSQSFLSFGITPYQLSSDKHERSIFIAQDTGAQFLIMGDIIDLSASVKRNQTNRQLALSVKVLDGKTGDVIHKNIYRDIAEWPFKKNSKVDTNSARFWTSTYGEMSIRLGRNILLDIENALSCHASTPEVVALNKNTGQINAGRIHGVQLGDELALWHNATFKDQFGHYQKQFKKSEISLEITHVYDESAEFTITPSEFSKSIQIGDITTKLIQ